MDMSMDNKPRKIISGVVALVLWLLTAVVGLWQIEIIGNMVFRLIAYFVPAGQNRYAVFKVAQAAGGLEIFLVMVMAVIWIAVVIGGAEYHRRRIGQPESWRLFGWTIAAEMAVFILALFI